MTASIEEKKNEVRLVLQTFQDGYTRRDVSRVAETMQLFDDSPETEIIGTNAMKIGKGEWCLGMEKARCLLESDWKDWGDVKINVDGARIFVYGDVAWLSAEMTTSEHLKSEDIYESMANSASKVLAEKTRDAKFRVLEAIRWMSNVNYELERGEDFVWPMRFTAVLINRDGKWLFTHMQFSYPCSSLPDERWMG